jgi:hypothetical protein
METVAVMMVMKKPLEIPLSEVEIGILQPPKMKITMPAVFWTSQKSTLLGIGFFSNI